MVLAYQKLIHGSKSMVKRPGSTSGRETRSKNMGEVKGLGGASERMENMKEVKGKKPVLKNAMVGNHQFR